MTEEEWKEYIYEWSNGLDSSSTVKDSQSKISAVCTLYDKGVMTGNEVREKLGMKPIESKNKER
jgi:hypothetical protein